jgi:23S rRNA (guanosine2251-2'-O)-methyltransferase
VTRPKGRSSSAAREPVILYGRNPVREALRGRRRIDRLWATPAVAQEDWLRGREVTHEDPEALRRRCGSDDHQGVCAVADPYPYAEPDGLLEDEDALVLALDEVQDPHNLGAACRVAEAGGANGVVIPERRAAEVTPAVCRASAGAVEHLPVARVRNLADWLGEAKEAGAWVYGADAGAGVPYDRPDYRGRLVLVLGSEGRGLRTRVAASCDELVALPLRGRVGSLNVSTAAAALVYGILQRREALDKAP